MLVENGYSFGAVEAQIEKWEERMEKESLAGGWHTRVSLEKEGWTETLRLHICARGDACTS